MPTFLTRCLAVLAVLLLPTFAATVPASAAPAECAGVWVVLQSDDANPSSATAKCATEYGTGLEALKSAGYQTEMANKMLSRIDSLPENADFNTNGGLYWSYWTATVNADGTIGSWTYATVGPDTSKPEPGKAEGWLLTKNQSAKGPVLAAIPEQAASAPTSTAPATPPADSGPPVGMIIGIGVVVGVGIGAGIWWFLRRRHQ